MPKQKISEFNSNPALNTDIDSINISEGCPPSGINDAIRELMSQLKDWQSGTSNDPYVVGSSGSLTLNQGTANTVPYLNGSKVVTSGTALSFDGTNLGLGVTPSSWGNGYKALQIGQSSFASVGNAVYLWQNIYQDSGGTNRYISTGTAGFAGWEGNTYKWYNAPSGTAGNAITFTQVMSLTAEGNLGLGVTPSAWFSNSRAIQMGAGACVGGRSNDATISEMGANQFINSAGTRTYISTAIASLYEQNSGQHRWYNAPSGTAGNAITFTQAMTLDASGNLGVGTTSPSAFAKAAFVNASGASLYAGGGTQGVFITGDNSTRYVTYTASGSLSGGHIWQNGNSEVARIDLSGNLLVGTTTNLTGGKFAVQASANNDVGEWRVGTNAYGVGMYNASNTRVGTIAINSASTTYSTTSDYRLKNTITPMTGALAKVALLKPCTYKWNADGSDGEGFIAHELAEVCPDAVVGEKDAVDAEGNPKYQGIDTSFLVATLTAAIQEQQAIIESLKARLDAANL